MSGLLSKNIKYFIAVMDEKNLSHAAQNLSITRSPLGKAIVELEVGIGGKLFIRKGNMLEPTERAIHLYSELKPVFDSLLSIEELFFYKKRRNQLHLYVDESYPTNLFHGIKSLQYIKELAVKVEKKTFSESTLLAVLDDPRSAMLTLRQEPIHSAEGRQIRVCTARKIHLLYASSRFGRSKNIAEIMLGHPIIKGGYLPHRQFADCLSFCLQENSTAASLIEEDIDLASMLNLISSGKAVTFIPENFLRFCGEGISSVVVDNITMTPRIICADKGLKYFDPIIEFVNHH